MPDDSTVMSFDKIFVGHDFVNDPSENYEGLMEELTVNGDSLLDVEGLQRRTGSRLEMTGRVLPRTVHKSDTSKTFLQNSLTFESQVGLISKYIYIHTCKLCVCVCVCMYTHLQ